MTEDEVRRIVREEIERRTPPPQIQPQPQGCICPPTSEQTCGNGACPRRGVRGLTYITGGIGGYP